MRKHICTLVAVAAAFVRAVAAQEAEPAAALPELRAEEAWRITGEAVHQIYTYAHDALQARSDKDTETGDLWESGDSDGAGWGARIYFGKGDGTACIGYIDSEYDYELSEPGYLHTIDSDRRDFEAYWSQIAGRNEVGEWGWKAGIRYIGLTKEIVIKEQGVGGKDTADLYWLLVEAGYHGEWFPFGGDYFTVYGGIGALIGEADGSARRGSDEQNDGKIEETYGDEFSLGYGANFVIGMSLKIYKAFSMSVDYRREWLYSFESTDSGTVVFPDNSDALFIENHHSVFLSAIIKL